MKQTLKATPGIPACAITLCIAVHGCREFLEWWSAIRTTQASSCGRLVTKRATEMCTTLRRNSFVHTIRRALFIMKVLCFMPDGSMEEWQPPTLCVRCIPLLKPLCNMAKTAKVTDHSSCVNTATPWEIQMDHLPITGTHLKTPRDCKVALCGSGKTMASRSISITVSHVLPMADNLVTHQTTATL